MTKYAFPTELYGAEEVLVPIDRAIVPIISGALEKFLQRYVWETQEDYQLGYNAIAKVMAAMSGNTLSELIEVQKATYRMLDAALNGRQYTEAEGLVSPPIPAVPAGVVADPASLRANIERLWQLGENAATGASYATSPNGSGVPLDFDGSWAARFADLQGVKDASWFGGGTPVQLSDILEAGRLNSEDDRTKLSEVIGDVDEVLDIGTDIGTFIRGFLDTAADLGTDGGVILTQTAIGVATLRVLQRLVRSIDGGEVIPPTDSVLFALRGDEVISSSNNVLSVLREGAIDSEGLGAAERLREIGITSSNINERIGVQVGGNTVNENLQALIAAQSALSGIVTAVEAVRGLLSQVYPLAEGNDIYSTLVTIADRTRHAAETLSQVYPLAEGNDIYSTLIAINDNARRSADCCEEGAGGDGLNPDPVPSGSCDWSATLYRVSSWTEVADVDDGNGGDLQTMWNATIDWAGEPFVADNSVVNNRRVYRLFSGSGQGWDICYYWNFTGQQAPRQIGFDVGATANDASNGTYTVPPDQSISGDASFDIPGDEFGDAQSYVSFNCQFERGVVPARNAWVKIRLTPLT